MVLAEEMGRVLVPGPFLASSVLCGQTVGRGGLRDQRELLLGKMCRGELVVIIAGQRAGLGARKTP